MHWSGLVLAALMFATPCACHAEDAQVARGRYLVRLGGCTDCHTPGHFSGGEDSSRFLGGSDVGFDMQGVGTFVGPNLTPDRETGLGNWTKDQIAVAIQTGVRPDGRILAPIMPWQNLAALSKTDVEAIVTYLQSLPPVSHKVAGPFGPHEKPPIWRMTMQPPEDETP